MFFLFLVWKGVPSWYTFSFWYLWLLPFGLCKYILKYFCVYTKVFVYCSNNNNYYNMEKDQLKYRKVYDQLENKACFGGRMPNLNRVSLLLNELGIQNRLSETWGTKTRSAHGYRYVTSGGTRTYEGYQLKVPAINLRMDSMATYYSWNNQHYAKQLLDLIDQVLREKQGIALDPEVGTWI